MTIKIILLFVLFLNFFNTGCGGSKSNNNADGGTTGPVSEDGEPRGENEEEEEAQNQKRDGIYRAFIRPLNTHTFGRINSGTAHITIKADLFKINLYIDDASQVEHMQAIYTGSACPELKDDLNKDGVIDFKEAQRVAGKMLIPLDGNLNSQIEGDGMYPVGMAYNYNQTTSVKSLMEDLKTTDPDPRDYLIKLGDKEDLNLSGRIILVHGVNSAGANIPTTASGLVGFESHETLPISCGRIIRIE